jgi:hypothetical protein
MFRVNEQLFSTCRQLWSLKIRRLTSQIFLIPQLTEA